MNRKQFRALIALNAFLLMALAAVSLAPSVSAQAGSRARGQYGMISGEVQGSEVAAIYIVDASNQEMISLYWDRNRRGFTALGYRNLAEDAVVATGGGR